MQFILNPTHLPFQQPRVSADTQYYEWKYRQQLVEEHNQQRALTRYLEAIQQQQQELRKQQEARKAIKHEGTFYDYNERWKKGVSQKVGQELRLQQEEMQKKEQSFMKSDKQVSKKEVRSGYKGPVQGWHERFQSYLKSKTQKFNSVEQEPTFEPRINSNSKKITEGMLGKVQDRLIMYGQFLKIKQKSDELNVPLLRVEVKVSKTQKYLSNTSQQSQLFYRLYREGEQLNKKRKQVKVDDKCTFQPKLNKLPEEMCSRIMNRRKPLYFVKADKEEEGRKKDKGVAQNLEKNEKEGRSNFQSFMKRNNELVEQRKKKQAELRKIIEQKQNIELSKCTFSPALSKRSRTIQRNSCLAQKQAESQVLEQIKQQLAPSCLPGINQSSLSVCQPPNQSQIYESESLGGLSRSAAHALKTDRCESTQLGIFINKNSREIHEDPEEQGEQNLNPHSGCEDSIDRIRSDDWEAEMQQIENQLQMMISKVGK